MPKEHRVSATTHVAAPRDVVWSVLCDLDRAVEWIESTLEIVTSSGPARLGATFTERSRISGFFLATIDWTVVEFDDGRTLVFEGTGVWCVQQLGYAVALRDDADGTECTLSLWYTPRFGPLGSVIELVSGSHVVAQQRRSAKTLAIIAERQFEEGPVT